MASYCCSLTNHISIILTFVSCTVKCYTCIPSDEDPTKCNKDAVTNNDPSEVCSEADGLYCWVSLCFMK